MLKELSPADLDHMAHKIKHEPYPGYPSLENRLRIEHIQRHGNRLIIPEGPWQVKPHANRRGKPAHLLDVEVPNDISQFIEQSRAERWAAQGILLDQYNRPIHPYWRQILSDPRLGLPTGIGFFYRYGPNMTVDPIIYRNASGPLEFLLIRRADNLEWGAAGGFEDETDTDSIFTGLRETCEEAGLTVPLKSAELIHESAPVGRRTTIHAWTGNKAYLMHCDQEYLYDVAPTAGDDAIDVGWFTREAMNRLRMFDDHPMYIETAMARLAILAR